MGITVIAPIFVRQWVFKIFSTSQQVKLIILFLMFGGFTFSIYLILDVVVGGKLATADFNVGTMEKSRSAHSISPELGHGLLKLGT